ncbi:MAG: hypothetical protein ACOCWC_03735 [Bacteroidota bacterium]
MEKWLITNIYKNPEDTDFKNAVSLKNNFVFLHGFNQDAYYYDNNDNSGLFLSGYYIPRLNSSLADNSLKSLYKLIVDQGYEINDLIKGVFTVIIIRKGNFYVYNDPLGLSKFFYTNLADRAMISNKIRCIKRTLNPAMSKESALQYYVFNYQLNGDTFYEGIKYSEPGSLIQLNKTGNVALICYIDIIQYLSKQNKNLSKKETFGQAKDLWLRIMQQWKNLFNGNKLSITLTSGLDSRIILGCFLESDYNNFEAFTFGHKQSNDVHYAKLLAQRYNVPHKHLYPDQSFFNNYENKAREVFNKGQGLVSLYRAHRLDAYRNIMKDSSAIFMGLAGSDLVRGIGYDGLIVTPVAFHAWHNQEFENFFKNNRITDHLRELGFDKLDYILDRTKQYDYIRHPVKYLFKVVIPLHFGQDVLMNKHMGYKTIVPFLDIDYLEFLSHTGYFGFEDYTNYRLYDYKKRSRGLFYSAKLVKSINSDLSGFTLGKKYTPNDILKSRLLVLLKTYYYKKTKKKYFPPNFTYGEWFYDYLFKFLNNNNPQDVYLNHQYLKKQLAKTSKQGGEFQFIDFTRAVNLLLAKEL